MLTFGVGGILLPLVVVSLVDLSPISLAVLGNVLLATAAAGALVLSASVLDRRPIRAYGFRLSREWWGEFVAGSVLGVALVAIPFALGYGLGWVTVVDTWSPGSADSFLAWFLLFGVGWLCVGFWEETLFRGLFVTNAADGLTGFTRSPRRAFLGAWCVSTVAFGVIHAPLGTVPGDASLPGMLVIWTLLGGLLGLSYLLSGELAFPIGLHFAVNYATNNVFFGVAPPDGPALPTVIRPALTAPELWHPIGGLTMVPGLLVGYLLICGWFYRRNGGFTFAVELTRRQS